MTIVRQVILIPDEDGVGYTVEVPSLPGCIAEYVADMVANGEEIPDDCAPLTLATVAVAA